MSTARALPRRPGGGPRRLLKAFSPEPLVRRPSATPPDLERAAHFSGSSPSCRTAEDPIRSLRARRGRPLRPRPRQPRTPGGRACAKTVSHDPTAQALPVGSVASDGPAWTSPPPAPSRGSRALPDSADLLKRGGDSAALAKVAGVAPSTRARMWVEPPEPVDPHGAGRPARQTSGRSRARGSSRPPAERACRARSRTPARRRRTSRGRGAWARHSSRRRRRGMAQNPPRGTRRRGHSKGTRGRCRC